MIISRKKQKIIKIILFAYIVLMGCCDFPFQSEQVPLDITRLYLIAAPYLMIGLTFAYIDVKKGKEVYISTLIFTAVGMVCRYFLEFGEVSNTYNFTLLNVLSFIAIVPVGTLFIYYIAYKTKRRNGDQR